jgi:hypothetical protein
MGIFKNGGGGKSKGFAHKPPINTPKVSSKPFHELRASEREVEATGEDERRGSGLVPNKKRKRKEYPIASLLLEYLELPPPRSLAQLATLRGLEDVPEEWVSRAIDESWGDQAAKYDDAVTENRIRKNWTKANETQESTLDLTDRLLLELSQADPTDRALTMGLQSMAATVKTLVDVRLRVLEGLQKPDSESAIELPIAPKLGQLELF